MTTFAQRIVSDDLIAVPPSVIHTILSTPDDLAELTPLIDTVTPQEDGDRWVWQLNGINALGISAAPKFTTDMAISDERIAFQPVEGTGERATATGHLEVREPRGTDREGRSWEGGTFVLIDLVATVELPLPKAMSRPVQRVMFRTMKAGGARFAENLLAHLDGAAHRGLDVRSA